MTIGTRATRPVDGVALEAFLPNEWRCIIRIPRDAGRPATAAFAHGTSYYDAWFDGPTHRLSKSPEIVGALGWLLRRIRCEGT